MGQKVVITSKNTDKDGYVQKSIYKHQLLELAEIRNPSKDETEIEKIARELEESIDKIYIEYPWRKVVIECVPEEAFIEIKTNRNKLLITEDEQAKLYSLKISIAGMSVGSSLAYGLVGTGIGKKLNIADDDTLSTSNLNRVQATILDVDEKKVDVAYRKITEMNPFTDVVTYDNRISEVNMNEFMHNGKADIIFEEIDDFRMKVVLREEAKRCKIPFVMLTNLGDSVLIDVERYDIDNDLDLFNGHVSSDLIARIKTSVIDDKMMKELSVSLVDRELIPERATISLKEIGNTLVGRPQLYGTVALDGGIAPHILLKIFIEENLSSGRYKLRLDLIF
jgi:molybdopterin/thiamine biosynthesis adenylyltransferase